MGKVLIGRLYHSFGVKGEAKVTPNTSFPEERFQPGKKVFLSKSGKEFIESSFEDVRGTLKEPIVKLAGIDVEKMTLKAPCAMKFALGENPKRNYGENNANWYI